MYKNFIMAAGLTLALVITAAGCAKHTETVYYQEWHVEWLTPVGTDLDIVGELYKPMHKDTHKQIGVYVVEIDGTPVTTIQYPILQQTTEGTWRVVANGYDRNFMLDQYYTWPNTRMTTK